MTKIIETNISLDESDHMCDFQSRVIKADNWNSYVNEISNGDTVIRHSIIGNLSGNSVPISSTIKNFKSDDFHLSCDIYNYQGVHTKKLAYVAESGKEIVFENGSIIKLINDGSENVRGLRSKVRLDFSQEYDNKFCEQSEESSNEKDKQK